MEACALHPCELSCLQLPSLGTTVLLWQKLRWFSKHSSSKSWQALSLGSCGSCEGCGTGMCHWASSAMWQCPVRFRVSSEEGDSTLTELCQDPFPARED